MPCTQRNIIYGEEMNQFLGMTSEWLADVFLNDEATVQTFNSVSETHRGVDDDPVLVHSCQREKYKCAQDVCGRITAEISDLPDQNFHYALEYLETWPSKSLQGDVVRWRRLERRREPAHDPEGGRNAGRTRRNRLKAAWGQKTQRKWTELSATSEQAIKPFSPRRRVGRPRKDRAADKAK
ncbi:hypothetical protein GQ600_15268 [Phytophthora cactorum]|nr:hypothetical protein GQ600_15268 [Phytophthora cactorum]